MEKSERISRTDGLEAASPGDQGAVVLQPEPPKRGTFALLLPGDMSWDVRRNGGIVRIDFRPMTRSEKVERQRRELARDRAERETQPISTHNDEENGR